MYELVACCGKNGAHIGNVGGERCRLCEKHEQAFGLLESLVLDVLHCRDVVVDNGGDNLLQTFVVTLSRAGLKEEGIVAGLDILLEMRQHFEVAGDGGGELHVLGEDVLQRECGQMSRSGDVEIFTEREAVEGVHAEAAGEIALGIVDFEE